MSRDVTAHLALEGVGRVDEVAGAGPAEARAAGARYVEARRVAHLSTGGCGSVRDA